MKLATVVIAGMLMTMTGCIPDPNTKLTNITPSSNARFEVKRVGVFDDELSSNYRRGIYILHDRETGKEYIGISGIGIAELQRQGKVDVEQ